MGSGVRRFGIRVLAYRVSSIVWKVGKQREEFCSNAVSVRAENWTTFKTSKRKSSTSPVEWFRCVANAGIGENSRVKPVCIPQDARLYLNARGRGGNILILIRIVWVSTTD